MVRTSAALLVLVASSLGGIHGVGIVGASPDDKSGQCTFGITPPTVVPVSGVKYVFATLRPGKCTMMANPMSSTVCLAIEGDDSAGQCAKIPGAATAELYVAYRPGATYIEKGEGCVSVLDPPYTLCQNFPASRYPL